MASMRELAMKLLSRAGSGPVLQPTNVYGQDPDLPIGYGEGEISPLDAAAMSTMFVPGVGDVTGLAADVDMYMRDPESRNIPNYLLTAAGALPFLPAASQVRKGIKAYHGSPYNFPPVRELEMPDGAVVYQSMGDAVPEGARVIAEHPLGRFDMSKLGTGEGAQAYGQGLYFAENEKVAKEYRDQLTPNDLVVTDSAGRTISIPFAAQNEATEVFKNNPINEAKKIVKSEEWLSSLPKGASRDDAIFWSDILAEAQEVKTAKGSMYEVNIDVEPDELIDWDTPISQQSKKVQDAVYANRDAVDQRIVDDYFGGDRNNIINEDMTGQQYMANMDKVNAGMIDGTEYELAERGVKGVRYADAFTRHKTPDKRSMNYVIFDDRLITIAKKYGIAIPAAAAMLARMTGEDTSQSYQEET
jgi:hypothetical protein